jgi:hypothetical protein
MCMCVNVITTQLKLVFFKNGLEIENNIESMIGTIFAFLKL